MSGSEAWSAATWDGSRREQIRRSLRLTVRERLEALEDMTEVSERLLRTAAPLQRDLPAGFDREGRSG